MLYFTDTNGVQQTGITQGYKETGGTAGAVVTLSARIYETDTQLVGRYVSASLIWNDGTGDTQSFGTMSIASLGEDYWELSASKRLLPGSYVSVMLAQNYRAPTRDTVRLNFFTTVTAAKPDYNPPRLLFGPILPRDSGFPNAQQWSFNLDSDLTILESSVKMLLLTAKGERLMEPDYGTNIRRILFDINVKSTESLIRQEIVSALAIWEPRVELVSMNVNSDPNIRSVTLSLTIASRLTRQPFETSVQYNR